MRLPWTRWQSTLNKLGLKIVWGKRPQTPRKVPTRNSQLEKLESREVMTAQLSDFQLVSDTGTSATDLVTSDSRAKVTVTGTWTGRADVEFDIGGDGVADATRSASTSGTTITYDPRWNDGSLRSLGSTSGSGYYMPGYGPPPPSASVNLKARVKEFDSSGQLVSTSTWAPLGYTLEQPSQPEFNITNYSNYSSLTSGMTLDYGTVATGVSISKTLMLQNNGSGTLTLDPRSLTLPAGFTLTSQLPETISPNSNAMISIAFQSSTAGNYGSQIHFINNDADESDFTLTLSATVNGPTPEIDVRDMGMSLFSGSSQINLGSTNVGTPVTKTFTIYNTGAANLNINASQTTVPSGFAIDGTIPSSIVPYSSATITLKALATVAGTFTGQFSVANNDSDEGPFIIPVSVTVNSNSSSSGGTIEVRGDGGYVLTSNMSTLSFGSIPAGQSLSKTITISNTGSSSLTISTGQISVPQGFSITSWPSGTVSPYQSTSMTIQASSSTVGTLSGQVLIPSSDPMKATFYLNVNAAVTSATPDIDLLDGASYSLTSNMSSVGFGSVATGATALKTFTIKNVGPGTLSIGSISLPSGFSLYSSPTSTTLAQNATTSFTVALQTTASGSYSGALTIASNDPDESPFSIQLSGTVANPPPEIDVQWNSQQLVSQQGSVAFGSTMVGQPVRQTLSILNQGSGILTISPSQISLPSGFTMVTQPSSTVAPGGSTSILLEFTAASAGSFSGYLVIPNNDSDEGNYTLTISGTAVAPAPQGEIDIRQGTTSLTSNSSTLSYGSTNQGTPLVQQLTIWNLGQGSLEVNKSGIQVPTGFQVDSTLLPSTLAPGASGTISVRMTAATTGDFLGYLQIPSNDSDESPFMIWVNGHVDSYHGTMQVQLDNSSILNGQTIDFGSVATTGAVARSLVLHNLGNAPLTVNTSGIQLPSGYVLGSPPATSTILPGASLTLDLRLQSSNSGTYSGNLVIESNDPARQQAIFALTGQVLAGQSEIEVRLGSQSLFTGVSSIDFGTVTVGTSVDKTITILNTGTTNLLLATNAMGLSLPAGISITTWPASSIAPGTSQSLALRYQPLASGTLNGPLAITSNDADEGTFTLTLAGQATQPQSNLQVSTIQLVNDTGLSSTDQLTTDPTVQLRVTGTFNGQVKVEFDHNNDGVVEGNVVALTPNELLTYDPRTTDPAVIGHEGMFNLRYRIVQTQLGGDITYTSAWSTFGFTMQAVSRAEIEVRDAVGTPLPSGAGSVDYGIVAVGAPVEKTLTIVNLGQDNLVLNVAAIEVPQGFTMVTPPAAVVAANGGQTTLTLRLEATATAQFNTQLRIPSTDADEGTYAIRLLGVVRDQGAKLEVRRADGVLVAPSNGSVSFGTTAQSVAKLVRFSMSNQGLSPLTINGSSIQVPTGFGVVSYPTAAISPGGSGDLWLRLDADTAGGYSGPVHIPSNSSGQASYDFTISGEVTAQVAQGGQAGGGNLTLVNVQLVKDTGLSSTDRLTRDTRLQGAVTGDISGGSLSVEVDVNNDGTVDGRVTPTFNGSSRSFVVDPATLPGWNSVLGSKTVKLRTAFTPWAIGGNAVFGNWEVFSLDVDAGMSLGGVSLREVGLLQDTGTSKTDHITSDPRLYGLVRGELGTNTYLLQFDMDGNGTVDDSIPVTAAGKELPYDPRINHASLANFQGNLLVGYRLVQVDSGNAVTAATGWDAVSLTLVSRPASELTISNLHLVQDSGVSSTDRVTSTVNLAGEVLGTLPVGQQSVNGALAAQPFVKVEFDSDGDGIVDGEAEVNGRQFEFLPVLAGPGAHTIHARVREFSPSYGEYLVGAWSEITITVQADPAPQVQLLRLKNDTGVTDDAITRDPTVTGKLPGAESAYQRVELDWTGDNQVDGIAYTQSDSTFEFLPRGLTPGTVTLRARSQVWDARAKQVATGAWSQVTFVYELAPLPMLGGLLLVNDTGVSSTDLITTDSRVHSILTGSGDLSGYEVEFDVNNDGLVDGNAGVASGGAFSYQPLGLQAGVNTVRARVSHWDALAGDYQVGAWVGLTFTLLAEPVTSSMTVRNVQFQKPTLDATGVATSNLASSDPAIIGTVGLANATPIAAGLTSVEIDSNSDGVKDAEVTVDKDGNFQFVPLGLSVGSHTVRFRPKTLDYSTRSMVVSPWQEYNFNLLAPKTNAPAVIASLDIEGFAGTSASTPRITSNPILVGSVTNDGKASGVVVEVDLNGDGVGDDITWTGSDGLFRLPLVGLAYGSHTVKARTVEWNEKAGAYNLGTWNSISFSYADLPNSPAVVSDWQVTGGVAPSGAAAAVISGQVQNSEFLAGVQVQVDTNADGVPDRVAIADDQGKYSLSIVGGTGVVQVRTMEIDGPSGLPLYSSWTPRSLGTVAAADVAATISRLEIDPTATSVNPDGSVTVAAIRGTVTNDDGPAGVLVELDYNNDGTPEKTLAVSNLGTFQFIANLSAGAKTIRARAKENVAGTSATQVGAWTSVSFTLLATPASDSRLTFLGLVQDTGNSSQDKATSNPAVQGHVEGTGGVPVTIQIDKDGNGTVDGTVTTDTNGDFAYVPQGLSAGVTTIRARVAGLHPFAEDDSRSWMQTTFVYSSQPDGVAAQALTTSADNIQATWKSASTNYESSLAVIQRAFTNAQATAQKSFDEALAAAKARQESTSQAARAAFAAAKVAAENALSTQLATASNALGVDLAAFAGDKAQFQLPSFEWPDAPPDFAYEFPDASELPTPPQRLVSLADQEYDYSQDAAYQGALRNADFAYERAVKAAEKILISAQQSIYQDWQSQKSAAQAEYRADMAEAARLQDQKRKEGTNPVDLKEVMAKFLADVVAENERFEREKTRTEDDYAAELERVASVFASGGLSATERDTAVHTAVVDRDERRLSGPTKHAQNLNELLRVKDDFVADHERWEADRETDSQVAFVQQSSEADAKLGKALAQADYAKSTKLDSAQSAFEKSRVQADAVRAISQAESKQQVATEVDTKASSGWSSLIKSLALHEASYLTAVIPKVLEATNQRIDTLSGKATAVALNLQNKLIAEEEHVETSEQSGISIWQGFVKGLTGLENTATKAENLARKKFNDKLDEADQQLKEVDNIASIGHYEYNVAPQALEYWSYIPDDLGGTLEEQLDRWVVKMRGAPPAQTEGGGTPTPVIGGVIGKAYDDAIKVFNAQEKAARTSYEALKTFRRDIAVAQESYDKGYALKANSTEKEAAEVGRKLAVDFNQEEIDSSHENSTLSVSTVNSLAGIASGLLGFKNTATQSLDSSDADSMGGYLKSLSQTWQGQVNAWNSSIQTNYSGMIKESADAEVASSSQTVDSASGLVKNLLGKATTVFSEGLSNTAAFLAKSQEGNLGAINGFATAATAYVSGESSSRKTYITESSDAAKEISDSYATALKTADESLADAEYTEEDESITAAFKYLKARAEKLRDMLVSQVDYVKIFQLNQQADYVAAISSFTTSIQASKNTYFTAIDGAESTWDTEASDASSKAVGSSVLAYTTYIDSASDADVAYAEDDRDATNKRADGAKANTDTVGNAGVSAGAARSKKIFEASADYAKAMQKDEGVNSDAATEANDWANNQSIASGNQLGKGLQAATDGYVEKELASHETKVGAASTPQGISALAGYIGARAQQDHADGTLVKASNHTYLTELNQARSENRQSVFDASKLLRDTLRDLDGTKVDALVAAEVNAEDYDVNAAAARDSQILALQTGMSRDIIKSGTAADVAIAGSGKQLDENVGVAYATEATTKAGAEKTYFLASVTHEFSTGNRPGEPAAKVIRDAAVAAATTTRATSEAGAETTYRQSAVSANVGYFQQAGDLHVAAAGAIQQANIDYVNGGQAIDDALLDAQEDADTAYANAASPHEATSLQSQHAANLKYLSDAHNAEIAAINRLTARSLERASTLAAAQGAFSKALVDNRILRQQALILATNNSGPSDVRQSRTLAALQTESSWLGATTPAFVAYSIAHATNEGAWELSAEAASYTYAVAEENADYAFRTSYLAGKQSARLSQVDSTYTYYHEVTASQWTQEKATANAQKAYSLAEAGAYRTAMVADANAEGALFVGASQLGSGTTLSGLETTRNNAVAASHYARETSIGTAEVGFAVTASQASQTQVDSSGASYKAYNVREAARIRGLTVLQAGLQKTYSVSMAVANGVYEASITGANNELDIATASNESTFFVSAAQNKAAALTILSQQIALPWVAYQRDLAQAQSEWELASSSPLRIQLATAKAVSNSAYQATQNSLYVDYITSLAEANRLVTVANAQKDYASMVGEGNAAAAKQSHLAAVEGEILVRTAQARLQQRTTIAGLDVSGVTDLTARQAATVAADEALKGEQNFLTDAEDWNHYYEDNQEQRAIATDVAAAVQSQLGALHSADVLQQQADLAYKTGRATNIANLVGGHLQADSQYNVSRSATYATKLASLVAATNSSPWAKFDAAVSAASADYVAILAPAMRDQGIAEANAEKEYRQAEAQFAYDQAISLSATELGEASTVVGLSLAQVLAQTHVSIDGDLWITGNLPGGEGERKKYTPTAWERAVYWFGGSAGDSTEKVLNGVDQFSSGMASSVTLGATDKIRGSVYGEIATKNHEGALRVAGEITGTVITTTITSGAAGSVGSAGNAVKVLNAIDKVGDVQTIVESTVTVAEELQKEKPSITKITVSLGGAALAGDSLRGGKITNLVTGKAAELVGKGVNKAAGMVQDASSRLAKTGGKAVEASAELAQKNSDEVAEALARGGKSVDAPALPRNPGPEAPPKCNTVDDYGTPQCFARDTLISTPEGPREIGIIQPGDKVWAFDFPSGQWLARSVQKRFDSEYQGDVYTLVSSQDRIETTSGHPFWVTSGIDLQSRPSAYQLEPAENEGESISGRWLNASELEVGDTLFSKAGLHVTLLEIHSRHEDQFPVSNLSILYNPNFAVGTDQVLVHNTKPGIVECSVSAEGGGRAVDNVAPNGGPLKGSGGPGKVYEVPASELKSGKDYIGKTRQPTVADRMNAADHKSRTPSGNPPKANILAEELTLEEMDGVEGLLIERRGLDNLSNKIKARDFSLEKNQSRLEAGKRILGEE